MNPDREPWFLPAEPGFPFPSLNEDRDVLGRLRERFGEERVGRMDWPLEYLHFAYRVFGYLETDSTFAIVIGLDRIGLVDVVLNQYALCRGS